MAKIDLKEVIKGVKQPTFDDAMIKRLIEGLDAPYGSYYKFIQYENSLDVNLSGTIDRDAEQELWSKKEPGFNQKDVFRHMGNTGEIDYAISRLYINCAKKDLMDLSLSFLDKCNAQNIPAYFKYSSNNNVRADQFIIYSNLENLPDYIQFLQEIGIENPDLVQRCGKPPILAGTIDDWIGIGDEPKEEASFTELRANIIESTLKRILHREEKDSSIDFDFDFDEFPNENVETPSVKDIDYDSLNYDDIREELRKAFLTNGIDLETSSFNTDNIQWYMADEKTRKTYDSTRKSNIHRNKEAKAQRMAEQVAFKELKLLDKMGVIPNGLEDMISATSSRYGFLTDLYERVNINTELQSKQILPRTAFIKDNLTIQVHDAQGKHEMSEEEKQDLASKMLADVTKHYTTFFETEQATLDETISSYANLYEFPSGQNENIDIEKVNLASKLRMLAEGKAFFETIGIPSEKTELVCNKAQVFLQDLEQKREEQERPARENRKREIDREFLYECFKETGITDPEELRKMYQDSKGLDVSEEDLEIVLASFTDDGNISPSQIGSSTSKAGIGLTDINQSVQGIRESVSQDKLTVKGDGELRQ